MCKLTLALFACLFLGGCADIPIKDGELVVGKDTTASIEDVGVARINRQF